MPNDSSDFIIFRNGFHCFFAEINNYTTYLTKLLSEGHISKDSALYPAIRLVQIQLVNLIKMLNIVERVLD